MSGMEIDNTKAIALPILFIVALVVAIFITRKSLSNALPRARDELRLGILFFGGAISTVLSIFLFPTAGWAYGIVSALFSYMFSLVCAPGMIEKHANRLFLATASWFALLLGIPNRWSAGIIARVSTGCNLWFTVKTDMCSDSWVTFATIVSIAVIIINFFELLVLMSFAADFATARKAAKGTSDMQQPLAANNGPAAGNMAQQ